MPRQSKGARLYLRPDNRIWYIREGESFISTRCPEADRAGAEQQLAYHITNRETGAKFGVGDPDQVAVLAVLQLYTEEKSKGAQAANIIRLGTFFEKMVVGQITKRICGNYVRWVTAQPSSRHKDAETAPRVSDQTARRDLEILRAAVNYAVGERLLKWGVPVELPTKSEPRDRWLSRDEVARLLWATRKIYLNKSRHVARFILIALYTGTRYDAILKLRWMPSIDSGWVDLDRGIMYRKGAGEKQTSKRRTPVPINDRLLSHMKRWRRSGTTHVVEYEGLPVNSIKTAWKTVRREAGLGDDVIPHILRHTFATWAVQDGQPLGLVAGALGTTEAMIDKVYGHHCPDRLRSVVNAVVRRRG